MHYQHAAKITSSAIPRVENFLRILAMVLLSLVVWIFPSNVVEAANGAASSPIVLTYNWYDDEPIVQTATCFADILIPAGPLTEDRLEQLKRRMEISVRRGECDFLKEIYGDILAEIEIKFIYFEDKPDVLGRVRQYLIVALRNLVSRTQSKPHGHEMLLTFPPIPEDGERVGEPQRFLKIERLNGPGGSVPIEQAFYDDYLADPTKGPVVTYVDPRPRRLYRRDKDLYKEPKSLREQMDYWDREQEVLGNVALQPSPSDWQLEPTTGMIPLKEVIPLYGEEVATLLERWADWMGVDGSSARTGVVLLASDTEESIPQLVKEGGDQLLILSLDQMMDAHGVDKPEAWQGALDHLEYRVMTTEGRLLSAGQIALPYAVKVLLTKVGITAATPIIGVILTPKGAITVALLVVGGRATYIMLDDDANRYAKEWAVTSLIVGTGLSFSGAAAERFTPMSRWSTSVLDRISNLPFIRNVGGSSVYPLRLVRGPRSTSENSQSNYTHEYGGVDLPRLQPYVASAPRPQLQALPGLRASALPDANNGVVVFPEIVAPSPMRESIEGQEIEERREIEYHEWLRGRENTSERRGEFERQSIGEVDSENRDRYAVWASGGGIPKPTGDSGSGNQPTKEDEKFLQDILDTVGHVLKHHYTDDPLILVRLVDRIRLRFSVRDYDFPLWIRQRFAQHPVARYLADDGYSQPTMQPQMEDLVVYIWHIVLQKHYYPLLQVVGEHRTASAVEQLPERVRLTLWHELYEAKRVELGAEDPRMVNYSRGRLLLYESNDPRTFVVSHRARMPVVLPSNLRQYVYAVELLINLNSLRLFEFPNLPTDLEVAVSSEGVGILGGPPLVRGERIYLLYSVTPEENTAHVVGRNEVMIVNADTGEEFVPVSHGGHLPLDFKEEEVLEMLENLATAMEEHHFYPRYLAFHVDRDLEPVVFGAQIILGGDLQNPEDYHSDRPNEYRRLIERIRGDH